MPFHIITTATTSDAAKIMDNFHTWGGNRLPMTQTAAGTLTAVDATYNLGTSTVRWANVHTNNLYITNNIGSPSQTLWGLVQEVVVTTATQRISFSVNGEYGNFILRGQIEGTQNTVASYYLCFNADTAGTYAYRYIYGSSITVAAAGGTTTSILLSYHANFGTAYTAQYIQQDMYLKSGGTRTAIGSQGRDMGGTYAYMLMEILSSWNNTATTVTSITAYVVEATSYFQTGTILQLWRRY